MTNTNMPLVAKGKRGKGPHSKRRERQKRVRRIIQQQIEHGFVPSDMQRRTPLYNPRAEL